ncbi:branched-chain amino acid ABC transporter permease [Halocynthiibacter namhaensis]|uniref:branched-chain amino acid ABC transporter permease n=1 Tax=Halocynthiibacter namhaensis TaxID=1290553 RepID=UPI000578FD58|nr:branched-chain amino acid ABC transporter permease [Halocynthiibacter namhaensis]
MSEISRIHLLHAAMVAALVICWFVLPVYHAGNLARIMVFAIYAMGYNLLFGYTGLLSLGHALFFGAGMYGLGLAMHLGGVSAGPGILAGLIAALVVSGIVGFLALRTTGVAFMIVTLMFAQAGYLAVLLFGTYTRGDEGFVLPQATRALLGVDLSDAQNRYFAALLLFSAVLFFIGWLVRTPFGRCLVAIRENEERARMLGYDITRHKLMAVIMSGTISGLSGAAYCLLFGSAQAAFVAVPYSIFPLLYVLLGGMGTTLGPFVGTLFMFYLIDWSGGNMMVAGFVLVALALFAPAGILGEVRRRLITWLP